MKAIFQRLLLVLAITASQQACPSGWRQSTVFANKCYLIVVSKKIWFEANSHCGTLAPTSTLTSISSAFENFALDAIVTDTPSISSCDQLWTGLSDFNGPNKWEWVDGNPFSYSNWDAGQPDLSQQCVSSSMRQSGKWKTENCGTENCYVCELYNGTSSGTTTSPITTAPVTTTTRTTTRSPTTTTTNSRVMTDCYDWLHYGGQKTSRVYTIQIPNIGPVSVYCDMDTNGGGWTVFQRRLDNTLSFFNKTWADYKGGFGGNPSGNLWLGNDKIHALSTKDPSVIMRIEIRGDRCDPNNFPGVCASQIDPNVFVWGEYKFRIDDESNNYMMHTSASNAGNMTSPGMDGFLNSDGKPFATTDRTQGDGLINTNQLGAWWFDPGTFCPLNGKYNSDTWGMYFNRKYNTLDYDIVPVRTEIKLRRS